MKHLIFLIVCVCASVGCESVEDSWKRQKQEAWEEPCHDTSTLLATTAGSPNAFACPNKHHKMHVQISTTSSNEEVGALVFCECVSDNASAPSVSAMVTGKSSQL